MIKEYHYYKYNRYILNSEKLIEIFKNFLFEFI
jgi:hypothetical protein